MEAGQSGEAGHYYHDVMRPAAPEASRSQIATSDLDVAVISRLPPSKLALRDQFKPGSGTQTADPNLILSGTNA